MSDEPGPRIETAGRAEHLQRGLIVNVFALLECVDQRVVFGEVRQHPQLNLRIISRNQQVSLVGDKRSPDFASELGANRDVLEVWIRRGEPSCGRADLVEGGVQASAFGVDQCRQGIDVRTLQF